LAINNKQIINFLKSKSAAKNIQDINGIKFLNELKKDLEEQLQFKIDEIIERIVMHTSQNEDSTHSKQASVCVTNSSRNFNSLLDKPTQLNNQQSYSFHSNSIRLENKSVQG
jgi:hypothetical protein